MVQNFRHLLNITSAFYIVYDYVSYKAYKKCLIAYFHIDNINLIAYNKNHKANEL